MNKKINKKDILNKMLQKSLDFFIGTQIQSLIKSKQMQQHNDMIYNISNKFIKDYLFNDFGKKHETKLNNIVSEVNEKDLSQEEKLEKGFESAELLLNYGLVKFQSKVTALTKEIKKYLKLKDDLTKKKISTSEREKIEKEVEKYEQKYSLI